VDSQTRHRDHNERPGALHRPEHRSFTGGAVVLGIAALVVAGVIGLLAWLARDRASRLAGVGDSTNDPG